MRLELCKALDKVSYANDIEENKFVVLRDAAENVCGEMRAYNVYNLTTERLSYLPPETEIKYITELVESAEAFSTCGDTTCVCLHEVKFNIAFPKRLRPEGHYDSVPQEIFSQVKQEIKNAILNDNRYGRCIVGDYTAVWSI